MDSSFLVYIQKLELIGFFAGYPLIYAIIIVIAGSIKDNKGIMARTVSLLPFAYAFVGILFLGFLLRKVYPDYSIEHIKGTIQQPYLVMWGLLSILFWIPALSKKKALSLLHGLVFFLLPVIDLYLYLFSTGVDNDIVKNDMKVYTSSLILNLTSLVIVVLLFSLFSYYRKRQKA
ncbi:MAG: hypothetical protein ACXVI9_00840 [Mucilaginibacter sp.]